MKSFIAFLSLVLTACSSQQTPPEQTKGIVVNNNIEKYWLIDKAVQPAMPFRPVKAGDNACVTVLYQIGSDGKVYNPKLAFKPENVTDDYVRESIRAIKKFKYKPAPGNQDRQPIITANIFFFVVFSDEHTQEFQKAVTKKLADACRVDIS